jgi:hypothetical protein
MYAAFNEVLAPLSDVMYDISKKGVGSVSLPRVQNRVCGVGLITADRRV